jgi:hypothetical protein
MGHNPAVNAQRRVITVYGDDPNAAPARGLLRDMLARVQGFLVPAVVGAKGDPGLSFTGYAVAPQRFEGAASVATPHTFRDGGSADISSGIVAGPMGDPARRMFAARLRRGRSL